MRSNDVSIQKHLWGTLWPNYNQIFKIVITEENLRSVLSRGATSIPGTPPVLSFFSGGGFLDLGIMKAGFPIVWSLEVHPDFCVAHDHGMSTLFQSDGINCRPPVITCRDDIRRKGPSAIRREALGTLAPGDYFGIIGGPPCPDFSVGGKNRGFSGNRGQLTQVFVERICELEPSFFLIENVKGLLNTHMHREMLELEIWKLEEKGYSIDIQILNALELGVPQDRERVFIVGIKRSFIKSLYGVQLKKYERNWFPWPEVIEFKNAKNRFPWPQRSPFGSTPPLPDNVPLSLCVGPMILDTAATATLPNGQEAFRPKSMKFERIEEGDDSRKSFKRLHRYRFSPTAAYGNNEVHLHPTQPRRLTVREALRIQTVPDNFALPEEIPLSFKFKLIGNGVPVQMAVAIGYCLRQFITGASMKLHHDLEREDSQCL